MRTYGVYIKQIEKYCITVEAESEEDAEAKAWELMEVDKGEYHDDSDAKVEVYEE